VQFFESSLAFVSRLLEEEGIYFSSVVEAENETIVFADDSPSSAPIEGEAEIPFRGQLGFDSKSVIFSMRELFMVRSGKFTLRDRLQATAARHDRRGRGERQHQSGAIRLPNTSSRPSANSLRRCGSARVDHETTKILADSPAFTQALFDRRDPFDDMGGEVMVARVVHSYGKKSAKLFESSRWRANSSSAGGQRDAEDVYVAEAKLIGKDIKFRTAQTTPRPVAHGPQTARVVAPAGAEPEAIHTDEHGRCKVKFHWDLGPDEDDKASCWMRTGQLQTSGSMALPRIGWEVVVEYLEGNPDRPVVTGKLYNGLYMPPYALPEGKTRTSMQSRSTPGGGGSNEIRPRGWRKIMMHAQHARRSRPPTTDVLLATSRASSARTRPHHQCDQTVKSRWRPDLREAIRRSPLVTTQHRVNAVPKGGSSLSIGGSHFRWTATRSRRCTIAARPPSPPPRPRSALDRVNAPFKSWTGINR
jgi:type VI secretion system secreted protein VgrG